MSQNPMQMSDNELKQYIDQVFIKYDKERDGTLKTLEMANYLTELFQILGYGNINITPEQAQQAIKMIDKNNDNKITKMELFLTFKELANTQMSEFGDVKIFFMNQGGFDSDNIPAGGQNNWGITNNVNNVGGGNAGSLAGWGVDPNSKPWVNSNTATQNTVTTNNTNNPWMQPPTNTGGNAWGTTNTANTTTNTNNAWGAGNNVNPNSNPWGTPNANTNNVQTNAWGNPNPNTNTNTNANNGWKVPNAAGSNNPWGTPPTTNNNTNGNSWGNNNTNPNNNTWGTTNTNTNNTWGAPPSNNTNNAWGVQNQNTWGNTNTNNPNPNQNTWGQQPQSQTSPYGNTPNQAFKGSQQNAWGPQSQQQNQNWNQQARGSNAQQQTFQQQARGSGTQMQPPLYVGGQGNYNQYPNQYPQQSPQLSNNLVWGNNNTQPLVWGVPGQRPGTPPSAAYSGNIGITPVFYDPYGGYRVGSANNEEQTK